MTIGLEFEQLNDAAIAIAEGIGPTQDILTALSDQVGTASVGFRGDAATGLGEALAAWFDVAATLAPILDGYAQAIMQTANEHCLNDVGQAERMGRLIERLDQGPGEGPR